MNILYLIAASCIVTAQAADPPAEPIADVKKVVEKVGDAAKAVIDAAIGPDVTAKGGWTYDYTQNGRDWGSLVSSNNAVNYCGETLN